MNIREYADYDGLGLAELVARKETNARELTQVAIAAANQLNPAMNAIVEVFEDAADSEVGNGPFAGVPFLIKDFVIMAKGRRQDMGSRLMSGFVASEDSHLMSRFRAAGLIAIGRTATPEFAFNVSTEPLRGGAVRNPWNPELMAGGSSGGSAAAVAAGITPFAHATDGGGSIRLPASCCGVFGLKPTRGRVSPAPYVTDPLGGLGVEFVVSRSVRDSAAVLDAVQGPAVGDRLEIAGPERPYAEVIQRPPRRLKIGFVNEAWSGRPADALCREAVVDAARLCASLGHELEETSLAIDHEKLLAAVLAVWTSDLAHNIAQAAQITGREPGPDNLEATILASFEHGKRLSAMDYLHALEVINEICRTLGAQLARYDVLLTPTCSKAPQLLGTYDANDGKLSAADWVRHIFDFGSFTLPWNVTGQPAMSVPLFWSPSGVPIGTQFVGRFADETTLLALAAQLATARPWKERKPPVALLYG